MLSASHQSSPARRASSSAVANSGVLAAGSTSTVAAASTCQQRPWVPTSPVCSAIASAAFASATQRSKSNE
jgi:hypothetical protein